MNLTDRESTTVLVALRHLQSAASGSDMNNIAAAQGMIGSDLLTLEEVDALCERINCGTGDSVKPMGLEDALIELEDDDDLSLYECEIGLFDLESDPGTAFESHTVYVAAEDANEANEKAQQLCEETIATLKSVAFSATTLASKVSPDDVSEQ